MDNIDDAQSPNPMNAIWSGSSYIQNFSLRRTTLYTISTGLFPCTIDISLSVPIASANGSSLTARFPINANSERADLMTAIITLQGAGFSCASDARVMLETLPPSSQSYGVANIANHQGTAPLLMISMFGLENVTLLSVTLPSVTVPFVPQSFRENISFALLSAKQQIIFRSDTGFLDEIFSPMSIDVGQPVLQLQNNAIRSSTTISIMLTPNQMSIPKAMNPSILVITMFGAGWTLLPTQNGKMLAPLSGVFKGAVIESKVNTTSVLRVFFSEVGPINASSPLSLSIFAVVTANVTQPANFNIQSAILNSEGSIIAIGSSGVLDSLVASTMGDSSPAVTFSCPLASASTSRIDVTFSPKTQYIDRINVPSTFTVTIVGSGFSCANSSVLKFISPFDGLGSNFSIENQIERSVLRVRITAGTISPGSLIWFQLGPCSTPRFVQTKLSNLSAAMTDSSNSVVAASTSGTLSSVVQGLGPLSILLNGNKFDVTLTPRQSISAGSSIKITLAGVGLVSEGASPLFFDQAASNASGMTFLVSDPSGTVVTMRFSADVSAGKTIVCSVSPLYGACPTNNGNITAILSDESGNILSATESSSYHALTTSNMVTVREFIAAATNGIVFIPEGLYAGKCNCNSTINKTFPARMPGAGVEMTGSAGRTIIDCSGTGMRCLFVQGTSIKIIDIIFKGGSSPEFLSANFITIIQSKFDSVLRGRETNTTASAYRSNSRKMFLNRTRSLKVVASDVNHVPTPTSGKYHISRKSRRISKQLGSESSPEFHSDSLIKKRDRRPTPRHLFRQLVPSAQSNSNRQLLQFVGPNSIFTMFQVRSTLTGGCVLVEAFNESVSLHGVSLINCSAVYGGGGFFNTSIFRASNGRAEDNIARQGGGVFVIAPQGASFELFDFLRNTVVTSEASGRQTNTVWPEAMMFTLVPDPVAAAGGGAWLWALSAMTNCKFIGNAALGESADGTSSTRGAHACGSGLYVLQTLNGSILSNLQFSTSLSMCSGKGCLAAGSMFLAFTGFNTQCDTLLFLESKVLSQGSFSESWGASIVVSDASSGMLKISNVQSFNCSAASSGSINGGCMIFPTVLNRSIVSKISIYNFQTNTEILQDSNGILLAFGLMDNSQISDITVHSINLTYASMWAAQTGLVVSVEFLKNSSVSSVFVTQLTWRIIEGFGRLRGGVVYIFDMDRDSILQSIYVQDSSFIFDLTSKYGDRMFFGWFLYIRSSESASAVILNVSAKNIVASVSGRGVYGANPGSGSRQAMLTAIYLNFPFNEPAGPVVMKELFFKSISQYCIGPLCQGNAIIRTNLDGFQFLYSPPSSIPTFQISDAVFESVANVCEGERCKVRGGCFALSTYSGSLRNVRMVNITLRAIGASANAGGAFLFLIFSNPVKSLLISNVSSSDIRVISEGATSFALGGVIAVLYANLSIDHFRSRNVTISCLGSSCQAVGGAMAFLSAQALSHKRYSHFFAYASNVVVSDSAAECSGSNCTAIGGAVFAGLAFRGSWEPNLDGDIISRLGSVILPLNFFLDNATISRNEVRSRSIGAMLAGAGVYVLLASVEVLNSKFVQNSMVSSNTSSFVRGAGFCISGPSSRATILSTEISYNSAGASGLGGGVYAGQNAALTCQSVHINFNTASQGGGLLNDLAAVHLFSSSILNNSASDKGGGIFCVVGASHENPASIILSHVILSNNSIRVANLAQVGACAYILGKVLVEIRDRTHIVLNGDTKYTTTEAIISTGMRSLIDTTSVTSCKGGSVLNVARTDVVSYDVVLAGPNIEEQFASQCTPACLFVPEINENVASSGFMASCVPCPRGTYSLIASSSPSDSVSSQCKPCPFGAVCDGGYNVTASNSYWGWKVSESELTNRFIRLPSGYACQSNCSTIAPCGGHRTGTLCGQCAENYSISFFATECVPSEQCASEKWGLLIFVCLFYQFAFSTWMFWSSESELLRQQSGHRSSAKVALEQIPLLRNLSESNINAIVAKMELVHVDAKTTILVQGQSSMYMYVIKQGILDVFTTDASGKESLKNSLVAPAVVGELSCINGSNCSTSVRASMDSDLWKLDRSCFDAVSDEDKRSFVMQAHSKQFISNLKNSKRPAVAEKIHVDHVVKEELGSDAFGVLMWFYQLAGIMLSVTSPLSYLDGSAVAYSVVSFFVNSKPSSDAAAELTSNADATSSTNSNTNSTKYQFCVDATFTVSQVHLTTVMYYVMWAFMMALLSHKRVWKSARNVFCEVIYRLAQLIELVTNRYRRLLDKKEIDFFTTQREKFAERQKVDIEIRGPVVLKWLITCFSAVATLMMQGTSCVSLDGLMNSNIVGHWIYDGRVSCFSNAGAVSGLWQVASAFGVAAVLVAPAILLRTMQRIARLDKSLRTQLEDTLLQAYSGNYAPNASHWKVVM